ncbi:hypothetical protein [Chryseobacterium sp.]|uniref:hypothetical protein n=1 Tax=Chryseobacterium sp. TaxID=1871047 RepID=UPI0025C4E08C|nr:hypothetical protein [Chryseobacterium sp.]
MKNLLLSTLVLGANSLCAQVGISTTSPQKALHVSGTTSSANISGTSIDVVNPTIRIDGLNNANQSIQDKLRPVSVTDQGDVVLSHLPAKSLLFIDPINSSNPEQDYIPSAVTINQTSPATSTNLTIRSFNFSLTSPSIVKFNTVTSFQFLKASDGTPITDGSNRTWGTRFRFSQAPSGISTAQNSFFGESIRAYSNIVDTTAASGLFYTVSDDTLYLPKGNYTLDINLFAGTESTQTPLRLVYGGGTDTVSIIAYPVQ